MMGQGGKPFFGHFIDILRVPPGHLQASWMQTVPNKGLIQYKQMFNAQRILVTSPQAVKEVLVEQSYTFIRPTRVAKGLSRIVGNGVLITEGDIHKVDSGSFILPRLVAESDVHSCSDNVNYSTLLLVSAMSKICFRCSGERRTTWCLQLTRLYLSLRTVRSPQMSLQCLSGLVGQRWT